MTTANAVFIHHPGSELYKFNDHHPFNPIRLRSTIDLLIRCGALDKEHMITPAAADDRMIMNVHREDYVRAVQQLSEAASIADASLLADSYGLSDDDTPYFRGMHDAAAAIVGGSVYAAEAVMSGRTKRAFHMAGGLHHAFPHRGAGFCIYNDAAVAIRHIQRKYGARIMYIDTDVHHGDGVQWVFYDDPTVFTYSIHETGKFLFPGTGFIHERGIDSGVGACMNVPLEPYTEDESWLNSFRATVEAAVHMFKPDLIVSQHGCDAHAFDPLSHMQCSMRIYREMPLIIRDLADRYSQGRWTALGGGGYDIWRVVPRAWSYVWLGMTNSPIVTQTAPGSDSVPLPSDWLTAWENEAGGVEELPKHWLDSTEDWTPMPRRSAIQAANEQTCNRVLHQ
ncbi:acetoin utilization protein AcuC [Paenibacillus xylaniclasticus]|uniref:acetoin utilization protein AcuC n=1 Tax=Paenibacillus xylaniclasticus TaxID=588083 RepID=UPI000FD96992|nr:MULTISPECIES: acetoin utilization protein AcuC [Paenibacillus]GFN32024.1 acetoin utilization protein AcuC [Paenibacillus curdlanolyticus]